MRAASSSTPSEAARTDPRRARSGRSRSAARPAHGAREARLAAGEPESTRSASSRSGRIAAGTIARFAAAGLREGRDDGRRGIDAASASGSNAPPPGRPFTRTRSSGSWPPGRCRPRRFRFYVEQNLSTCSSTRARWRSAAAKAEDVETMRLFSADLANIVESEIPENRELLRRVLELGAERPRRFAAAWRRRTSPTRASSSSTAARAAGRGHGRDRAVHLELRRHRLRR